MAEPAARTQSDLARRALTHLRIVRAGEAPTAVQETDAIAAYVGLYAELGNLGVAFWDIESIPVLVFEPLSRLLAQELAAGFGKDYAAGEALSRIYAAAAKPWSGRTVQVKYY